MPISPRRVNRKNAAHLAKRAGAAIYFWKHYFSAYAEADWEALIADGAFVRTGQLGCIRIGNWDRAVEFFRAVSHLSPRMFTRALNLLKAAHVEAALLRDA